MKKKVILVISIAALLICAGFLVNKFLLYNSLLSGDIKNVVKTTLIKDIVGSPETKILSNLESTSLLDILKDVRTKTNRYPEHLAGMQNDPKYTIEIAYADGTVDKIYSTENQVRFYRFIDTKGSSGDRGYIISEVDESIIQILEKSLP